MDQNRSKAIAADGYQKTTDPEEAKLEIESVSLQSTTQKVNIFVKFCIENNEVCDERRLELVPCTTSG